MNIFVTGAQGQLAQELKKFLPSAHYLSRSDCDLSKELSISEFFKDKKADLIINCAAYTQVDHAEDERELALKVNAKAPEILGKISSRVIHFSTDYVFDGQSSRPYGEEDVPNPVNFYGETKLKGEEALLKVNPKALVIRTSWLYSKSMGKNFYHSIKRLIQEKEHLGIVFDQVGTPTNASALAQLVASKLIQSHPSGVFHYSNEGVASWYDFAKAIQRLHPSACKIHPIESKDYPTKAARPHFSVLNKKKIKTILEIEIDHWTDQLMSRS